MKIRINPRYLMKASLLVMVLAMAGCAGAKDAGERAAGMLAAPDVTVAVSGEVGEKSVVKARVILPRAVSVARVEAAREGKELASGDVSPAAGGVVEYGRVRLEVPAGAVSEKVRIRIVELERTEKLGLGMKNVTAGALGYRFLPDGMRFAKSAVLKMGYEKNEVGSELERENLYTYYYNARVEKWEKLDRVAVDETAGVIVSVTEHFTDMVNSTLTLPENPKTLSFNPTSVKDVKGGDPGMGIRMIEAPEANQQGSANLKLGIEVPGGRLGMGPQLEVGYSSDGGNGWMGLGWSLGVSAVSVETRWGVPRYSGSEETETYVLDGEMLAPVAHRGGHVARSAEKQFWPRVEGSFRKIVRHGTGPANYWWEVTEKNGTKRFYGGTPEDGVVVAAVQGNGAGIAQWNLVEERDAHGNYVRYGYAEVSDSGAENGGSGVAGTQSYLDVVEWTGNRGKGLAPTFRVELTRDREQAGWPGTRRGDAVIDCRGGYKNVTADLLKRIEVYEGTRLVRSYGFDYGPGAYGKSLLRAVVRYGSDGAEFYRETFEYYDEVRSGNEYAGFGGEVAATVPGDLNGTGVDLRPLLSTEPTVLGTTTGWHAGVDGYLGINWAMGFTKTNSAGVKLGYNWSGSDTQTTMMDIDGDGVTDKVFIDGGRVHYRKGSVSADGMYAVTGAMEEIPGDQIRALGVDTSKSFSIGAEAYPLSISASLAYTTTWTDGEVYFTDANGDGLSDLVNRNVVYFCHLEDGKPVFGVDSGATEAPVGTGAGVAANAELEALLEAQYQGKVAASPPVDAVVEWKAPYTGTVRVSGTVKLSDDEIAYEKTGSAEPVTRETYADEDGVRVSVQRNGEVIWPESGEALDIGADDFTTYDPGADLGTINVTKGDRLYFRVNPKFDGLFDEVEWTPGIQYVTVGGTAVDEGNQPRDGNGLLVYRYGLDEDFAYAGRSGELYPGCVTTVTAGGVLRKGVTSDAVTVRVYRINAFYNADLRQYQKVPEKRYERTFTWDEPFDGEIAAAFDLDADDGASFEVTYTSAVDVQAVNWAPEVAYDHYHDAEGTAQPLVDGNGQAYTARLPGYWKGVTYRPENGRYERWAADKTPWVTAPSEGREPDSVVHLLARVSVPGGQLPEYATSFSGGVVFTVKRTDGEEPELMWKCPFAMDGDTTSGQTVDIEFALTGVEQNGLYSFDFHFEDENLRSLAGCGVQYRYGSEPEEIEEGVDPGGQPVLVPNWHDTNARNVYMAESENLRPAAWRGWSVFAYNAKVDGGEDRGAAALHEGDLVIDEDYLGPNVNPETGEGAEEPKAYVMYPAPGEGKWKSPDAECYVRRDAATGLVVLSGSRKGDDHPKRTVLAQGGGGMTMMNRLTWAYQVEGGVGVSIVPEGADVGGNIGGNLSGGESFSAVDYMDFNGDRLPDLLSETTIQYSAVTGGLSAETGSVRWKRTNRTLSGSLSGGPDFTIAGPKSKNKGQVYLNSMSGGGNVGGGLSDSTSDYQDMNGDGLPDMVSLEDGSIVVRLNTGYGFAGPETWGSGDLNASVNLSGGLSLSLGFNVDNFSFGGGLSGGINYSGVKATLLDINGDGLPDLVRKRTAGSGDLLVRLNTGAGFSSGESVWTGGMTGEALSKTYGASAGVNAHATIGIPVTTIFVNFVIIISAGGNAGVNVSRQTEGLRDVNADGCPDWVASEDDGELRVRYNRIGRTNLLSRLAGPLGGRMDFEYERSLPTQENPQMKWVMSGVRVNDGHAGDGEDEQYIAYSYADGKYSRYEREGYGFGTVTSRQRQVDGGTELETVTTYATDSYYRKGLVLETETRDGDGNLLSRTTNEYALPEAVAGTDPLVYFTKLLRTRNEAYEPGSSGSVVTGEEYTGYDGYGNVTGYTDLGEVGDWTDDVRVSIEYADEPAKIARHIVGLPESIEVRDYGNNVVRWREGEYDDEGSLVRHRAQDGTQWLETVYTHDAGTGNTLTVTDPTGYRVSYEYDAGSETAVTRVSDSLGYSSRGTYDLGLGVPLEQTDLNGNVMRYEYDAAGRLVRVFGPYDVSIPAVEFAYYHAERPARAMTWNKVHFDPVNAERLVTAVFADGLGRIVQTKKQSAKWDSGMRRAEAGMTVSGLVEYDEFGRTRYASQPGFTAGDVYTYTTLTRKNATETEYDERGRAVKTIYPDPEHSTVTTAYRIRNGMRETEVTDPLGRVKTSLTDSGGNIVSITQRKGTADLVTSYVYDVLSQIVEVRDADPRGANVTRITYDRLGRRTSVETPDAGLVTYEYDASGRLWRKVDARLRAAGQYIEYGYDPDSSRLSTVTYPATGSGGVVRYVYGTNAETNINAAGRLLSVQNPMSLTSYEYGKLGETVTVRKVLKRRWGHDETYASEMRYRFDYLGRMEWLRYPDGEELAYGYDRGGEVTTVTGSRDGQSTAYVREIGYDEFGQRVHLRYGNNVTTEYEYHQTRRWLAHIRTVNASNKVIQDMTYTFDRVGNVRVTENRATGKTIRQEYGYDDLDELVSAKGWYEDRRPGGVTVRHEYEQKFDYDAIGNMVTKTSRHLLGGRKGKPDLNYSFDYTYEKSRPHCAVTVGEYGYVYDANGNVTEEVYGTPAPQIQTSGNEDMGGDDGDPDTGSSGFAYGEIEPAKPAPGTILRQYVWDDENRMTEAVVGNEHVYFGYDASGERTVKYTEHGETVYVDRMYQVEPTKNPNLYTKHIFVGETRLVSRVGEEGSAYAGQNGEMYYYHPDHLGNTTWVTDNAGAEYEHVEYAPYGESWVDEGRDSLDRINHLFTSKELDKETGLYYFGARYLDPKTSRWMSTDPAMEKYLPEAPVNDEARKRNGNLPGMGGVFNAVNLVTYHYGANNPVKYVDPNGRDTKDPPATRKLSVYEECFVRGAIGDTFLGRKINYSAITLVNNDCEFRHEWTAPGFIFCNTNRDYLKKAFRAVFIHEIFHQFQYQTIPNAFAELAREQVLGKANNGLGIEPNPYNYGDISKLKTIYDIKTLEGQGQFIEDFILSIESYLTAIDLYNKRPNDKNVQNILRIREADLHKRAEILKNSGMKSDCIDEFSR